ncbi:Rho GTPase activating protein, partial [Dipsacomyces acuminosporus]
RYSDFLNLNGKLRHAIHRERISDKLERLPDKDIFRANAPTKNDKRKLWFERYLKKALTLSIEDKSPILEFLSTNVTTDMDNSMPILLGHKEGYLVKKGKNFGGWKRRYYVCKSNMPVLEYSELPGAPPIGVINLRGAVVKTGRSKSANSSTMLSKNGQKDMFRHAFLIEERPKREGKDPVAHPLWADSDRERDEWVTALRYVIVRDSEGPERAMDEVARYATMASQKDSSLTMINQIQTSLTHDQGLRQSLEHSRMMNGHRQPKPASSNGLSGPGAGTAASQLSKQAWPVTASLSDIGRHSHEDRDSKLAAMHTDPAADNRASSSSMSNSRPRSLSYPPNETADPGAASGARPDASRMHCNPSAANIAASLSASFSAQDDALAQQGGRVSVHYAPSEISTIESSLYSSYHDNAASAQSNAMASRSIDVQDSLSSMPDSPTNPQNQPADLGSTLRSAGIIGSPPQQTNPTATATATSASLNMGVPAKGQQQSTDPSTQIFQAIKGKSKVTFTKDSVGRIMREEEYAPDLPSDTPLVTDDILGVGRHESRQADGRGPTGNSSGTLANIFNGSRTRSREEKKRGRITFMWGKRKQSEQDLGQPDQSSTGSSGNSSSNANAASDLPQTSAQRRLRRGSVGNDSHSAPAKNKSGPMPVFGVPLEAAVQYSKVREHYELPAVVYRCIEFLDAKRAWLEEGIYRQSGSFSVLDSLRKAFNTNRDYNLLKLSSPPDIHTVASLLKAYLRELPQSVLTPHLHQDFVRVVDLADRRDRIDELGRLVSLLPLANYTLLRALTAHLIRVVQKASLNKMTLRNIGIVFSPSLGIPVGVFSLLMVEFEYIFWVNDSGAPEPRSIVPMDGSNAPEAAASSPADLHGTGIEQPPHKPGKFDRPLSASMPAGINRIADDDCAPSAGGGAGNDAESFVSDLPAHPAPVFVDRNERRDVAMGSNVLRKEGGGGPRVMDNTLSMAAVTSMPWYAKAGIEDADAPQTPLGRSNRNSIQYSANAPFELIYNEADIKVPEAIAEYDDDGSSFAEDPMLVLTSYPSNQTFQH